MYSFDKLFSGNVTGDHFWPYKKLLSQFVANRCRVCPALPSCAVSSREMGRDFFPIRSFYF